MNPNIVQYIGIGLLLFAGCMWWLNRDKKNGGDGKLGIDDLLDVLKNIGADTKTVQNIAAQPKPDKIRLLKEFVSALDKKKDKDKIEYIIENFGLDFLKEHISDE